jgi:hypothetical protein
MSSRDSFSDNKRINYLSFNRVSIFTGNRKNVGKSINIKEYTSEQLIELEMQRTADKYTPANILLWLL